MFGVTAVPARVAEARLITAVKRIRQKVKSKAPSKKDITRGTPYAIALCDPDSLIDKVDLEDALYGTPVVDIAVPSGEVIGERRLRDGFFGPGQDKPKNQRVTGVLAVQKLAVVLYGDKPVLTLFENPYVAVGDLPELPLPISAEKQAKTQKEYTPPVMAQVMMTLSVTPPMSVDDHLRSGKKSNTTG